MRCAVNAAGQPAHNGEPQSSQAPRKITRHFAAVIAGAARADHGHRFVILGTDLALYVTTGRRISNHAEPSGIAHIRERHYGDFRLPDAADFGFDLLPSGKIHQTFDNGFIEPRHLLQFFRGRRKNPRWIAKMIRALLEMYVPSPLTVSHGHP